MGSTRCGTFSLFVRPHGSPLGLGKGPSPLPVALATEWEEPPFSIAIQLHFKSRAIDRRAAGLMQIWLRKELAAQGRWVRTGIR